MLRLCNQEMKCFRHTHLFLQVLYSTLRIGLHDSFLASFCIFPASEEKAKEEQHVQIKL